MKATKQWYAIYTRPRWEKKVAERLTQNDIEAYCPLNKVWRQWADRKKIIYEPLFTSYVFVRIADIERVQVKDINGIINFVYWIGKPAVIREEEIDAIKHMIHQFENVKLEKVNVNVKDKVKITNGAFVFREGNIIEVQSKSVKVYLPSLGYQMIVEIEKSNIEVIKEFERKHQLVS